MELAAITPSEPLSQEDARASDLKGLEHHRFRFASAGAGDTWSSGLLNVQTFAVETTTAGAMGATYVASTGVFTIQNPSAGVAIILHVWMPSAATA